jgi:hypothetical protein
MRLIVPIAFLIAISAFCGCSTIVSKKPLAKLIGAPDIVEPISEKSSAIAISIDQNMRFGFLSEGKLKVDRVYFIKLRDMGDTLKQDKVIASNYYYIPFMAGFQAAAYENFLLNVEPGFYAAVGASADGIFVYLPKEVIEDSIVEVKPCELVFMGYFKLDKISYDKRTIPDDYQLYYFSNQLFYEAREYQGKMGVSHRNVPQFHAPKVKENKRNADIEASFLKNSITLFKNSGWEEAIENRLRHISQ